MLRSVRSQSSGRIIRISSAPLRVRYWLLGLLALASSLLLVLSFPDFNLTYLAWIAILPLLFAIDGLAPRKAFAVSYLTGVVFFLGVGYWLIHVTLPGMIGVVLFMGLYFGIFGLIVSYRLQFTGYRLLFLIPAAWVTMEWLRSTLLGGFGWSLLAHSQSRNLPIIQIADITGAYGVSFIVALVNAAIFLTVKDICAKKFKKIPYLLITVFLLYISVAYGILRVKNIFTGQSVRVAVVQGNIPQDRKWDALFAEEILSKYERLTVDSSKEKPDLIIWPETSVPGYLGRERILSERLRALAASVGTHILAGAPTERSAKIEYYNSAILFSDDGRVVDQYDKIHLVPFGEYLPFKAVFSFVENFAPSPIGDFSFGRDYKVFKFMIERGSTEKDIGWKLIKKVKFSCLICFEDIFPDMARKFVKNGAAFLVNITNDAWFGNSSAPYQHVQCSVFRAVENRVNVVRAANTGLSCFIDQKGRVTDVVSSGGKDLFIEGYRSRDIILTPTRTFYTFYGDLFAYACMLYVLFCFILKNKK